MSAEALRKNVVERLEKMNADAMTAACSVRPMSNNTADGIAMVVIDNLAMARGLAAAFNIVNEEFNKLTRAVEPEPARTKPKEVY